MFLNIFDKFPIPEKIPISLQSEIDKCSQTKKKDITLKNCFFYVVSMQKGGRINIVLQLKRLFITDFEQIYKHNGFLYCTHMNYLLRIMLINSRLFNDKDIELKLTNTWYLMPHQYLRIRLSKSNYIDVDPWAYQFGIDFGNYGHGFKAGNLWGIR